MPDTDKTIRIILLADTHLGFDYPIRPRIERRRRGNDFFDNFRHVLDYASRIRADFVVHGGDFFFRAKIPPKIIDLAYEKIFRFTRKGIPLILVPGNHERSRLPRSILFTHPDVHIFDRPKTIMLNNNGVSVGFAGFPCERKNIRDRFPELIKQTEWEKSHADIRLLCFHQTVQGARVGPSDYTFRYGKDVIRIKDIPPGFHAVAAGHIHRQQVLLKTFDDLTKSVPIIYPGSTERTSFAEKAETKGFYEITFCPSADTGWKLLHLKFHPLPARPMIDLTLNGDMTPDNIKGRLASKLGELPREAIVRLKIDGRLDEAVKSMLTSAFLRSIFPPTMNFQYGSEFFGDRRMKR